jgi:hypothetical protein
VTEAILQELNKQCGIRSAVTELAIAAGQHTAKVDLPEEYQDFTSVFGKGEAKRFPPSRQCNHVIEFKPNTPDTIKCKVYL